VSAGTHVDEPPRPIDDVRIRLRRELPPDVVQARLAADADNALNEAVARPRIAAVLTACKLVAQELERLHRQYADMVDLDLTGYSRASALWLLSGRELGLLRALLVQVEAGICNEAMVTGRAMHEAAVVLASFSVPDEEDCVRVFLNDEGKFGYVKQSKALAAQERYEEELAASMEAAGAPRIPPSKAKMEELYDRMSRGGHNRRSSIVDAFWEPGRLMAYGYNSSPIRQAGYASWAATMTIEAANVVGDALRALYSSEQWFTRTIVPLIGSIEALRETQQLDERSIRRAAGTL
jgi:hypothetical protein